MIPVNPAAGAATPMACSLCGAVYPADARFCPLDGSPLGGTAPASLGRSPNGQTAPGRSAGATATDPYVGQEIHGHIEIRELVGIGAMGRVYRAFQKGIDRDVAVKILHRELSASQALVARFHREAKVASRLAHPHVVHVLLVGQLPDGATYMVMEYLDGISLQRALAAAGRTMPLARALHVVLQVCEAAGEAHEQGIVHRDLKPENVMLIRRANDRDFVKVLDFGIARQYRDEQSMATEAGLVFGTARYISPEGARGETMGPQGDVYSIATIAYQLLSGRTPFEGDKALAVLVRQIHDAPRHLKTISEAAHVPEPVASVIMTNLAKRFEVRAENARAFAQALLEAAVASGLSADEISSRPSLLGGAVRPAQFFSSRSPQADTTIDDQQLSTMPRSTPLAHSTSFDGMSQASPERGRHDALESVMLGRRPRSGALALALLCFVVGAAGMSAIASRHGRLRGAPPSAGANDVKRDKEESAKVTTERAVIPPASAAGFPRETAVPPPTTTRSSQSPPAPAATARTTRPGAVVRSNNSLPEAGAGLGAPAPPSSGKWL